MKRIDRLAIWLLLTLGLCGCAGGRILVTPSCTVPNSFERCKEICMRQHGQRPIDSWEDAKHFECSCAPFDASNDSRRRRDRVLAALRAELDAIIARTRVDFERGDR